MGLRGQGQHRADAAQSKAAAATAGGATRPRAPHDPCTEPAPGSTASAARPPPELRPLPLAALCFPPTSQVAWLGPPKSVFHTHRELANTERVASAVPAPFLLLTHKSKKAPSQSICSPASPERAIWRSHGMEGGRRARAWLPRQAPQPARPRAPAALPGLAPSPSSAHSSVGSSLNCRGPGTLLPPGTEGTETGGHLSGAREGLGRKGVMRCGRKTGWFSAVMGAVTGREQAHRFP